LLRVRVTISTDFAGLDSSKGTDAKHCEGSGAGSPHCPCSLSKSSFQELPSCRCIQMLYSPAGIVTSPKARSRSVLKVVELSAPKRHTPPGFNWPSNASEVRPLSEGRP